MSNNEEITIQELDPDIIPPRTDQYKNPNEKRGSKIVVIGKPGTGKSSLIKSLLYCKKHIFPCALIMSGTEDCNANYSKFVKDTFIYNRYVPEVITEFIKRQKLAVQHLENPWCALVVDDCTDDPTIFNTEAQRGLFKLGRNWQMMYILSLQYAMDVKPEIRTNIDGVFILREPLLKNRKSIYENYASIIPTFEIFCDLLNQLTDDFGAIFILNSTTTNDWTKCVYYWKSVPVPDDWQLGCFTFHDHHRQRYNPDHTDTI